VKITIIVILPVNLFREQPSMLLPPMFIQHLVQIGRVPIACPTLLDESNPSRSS
jgi:hypothetical protein